MVRKALSLSAQGAAAIRSLESYRPCQERLVDDPLGSRLLQNPLWRGAFTLARISPLRQALLGLYEWQSPGSLGLLLCRTRAIDDALVQALERGLDQVVTLGTGLDTRAYRLAKSNGNGHNGTRYYELDHPAALARKQARLASILGELPPHVAFVPIDLEEHGLDEGLSRARFRTGAQTFYIWEGVTQYFSASVVDATLQFVTRASAAGSRIAFTYLLQDVVNGSASIKDAVSVRALAQGRGKRWITGFDPDRITPHLSSLSLAVVDHSGAAEWQERYLAPRGRRMKVFRGERLVVAEVAGSWAQLNGDRCGDRG